MVRSITLSALLAVFALGATAEATYTKVYRGNGLKTIGLIKVTRPSVLYWHNSDDPDLRQFLIYDRSFKITVTSSAASGTSYVAPGTYRQLNVSGGDWYFSIRPKKR